MQRRLLSVFTIASTMAVAACSLMGDPDPGAQEADHTVGEPTFAQHSWLWADETLEEFEQHTNAEFLPVDHPMNQRLQFWIDRIDDAFRSRYPDKLKATPKPKVIIQKSDVVNAWVSGIPVAWNVNTRVAGEPAPNTTGREAGVGPAAEAHSEQEREPLFFLDRSGTVLMMPGSRPVFDRTHDTDKLASFVRFHNENFSNCRMESNGEEVVFNGLCSPAEAGRRSERLGYFATGTHVTFTTGFLMKMLVEDRIVATIAHELGHFYRSHANMPTDVVNYFYSLESAHAHKPAPEPQTIEQTAKVRAKIRAYKHDYTEENALMKERNLGFYTNEQEADEIALEMLAVIGVPPNVAIDLMLEILKLSDARGGDTDAIKWAECTMLRDQGWRDADGKLVSVPVGDPIMAHHNGCFRAFNVARELQAHRYQLGARPVPQGVEWSALVARLANDLSLPSPPPHDSGVVADAGVD